MYVTQGSTEYEFILERAPLEALVIDGQVKLPTQSQVNLAW